MLEQRPAETAAYTLMVQHTLLYGEPDIVHYKRKVFMICHADA